MIKLVCFVSSTLLSHTALPEDEHPDDDEDNYWCDYYGGDDHH